MNKLNQSKQRKEDFLRGLSTITGLSYKKLLQYSKENNPFNILEHPYTIEPNGQQLEKIKLLNEFISSYNLLKIYESEDKLTLDSSSKAGKYFVSLLSGMKDKERFLVAYLDTCNNIIETKIMSEGTIGGAVVYPRDILKSAIFCDCTAVILSHNHPGCSLSPTKMDIEVTQRLVDIFIPLNIKVLDHIIVGGTSYYSMSEQGQIRNIGLNSANFTPVPMQSENIIEKSSSQFVLEDEDEWELC